MTCFFRGRPSEGALPPRVIEQLHRFRHRVFRERLCWDVPSRRGREEDEYDHLDPVHIAAWDGRRVTGSFRLLPTTGSYMLRDVFPELLRGERAPMASDVWELSRFAAEPPDADARVQLTLSDVAFGLMRECHVFAHEQGVREFVFATSVAVERLMRGAGIPMTRFGDGRPTRIGRVLSVACRIEVVSYFDSVFGPADHGEQRTASARSAA